MCEWILKAWNQISEESIRKGFKKCYISNALDGSEDENENENNANEDSESSSNISDNHKISDLEATADETDEELIEIRIISEEEETESTSETQL
jgi:hypothetical protein